MTALLFIPYVAEKLECRVNLFFCVNVGFFLPIKHLKPQTDLNLHFTFLGLFSLVSISLQVLKKLRASSIKQVN